MERSSEPSKIAGASGLAPGSTAALDLGTDKRAEFASTLSGVGTVASDARAATPVASGRGRAGGVAHQGVGLDDNPFAHLGERNAEGVPSETESPVTAPIAVGGKVERAKVAWARAPRPARIALAVSAGIVLVSTVVLSIQGILSIGEPDVDESSIVRLPTAASTVTPAAATEPVVRAAETAPPAAPAAPAAAEVAPPVPVRPDWEPPVESADRRRARGGSARPAESAPRVRPPARAAAEAPPAANANDPDDVLPIVDR